LGRDRETLFFLDHRLAPGGVGRHLGNQQGSLVEADRAWLGRDARGYVVPYASNSETRDAFAFSSLSKGCCTRAYLGADPLGYSSRNRVKTPHPGRES
jgi:hypothetical protein